MPFSEKIIKQMKVDIENLLSTNAIISKYATAESSDPEHIIKFIRKYKWDAWKREGRRL